MKSKLLLFSFLMITIGLKSQHYAIYRDMSPSSSSLLLEMSTGGGGTEYTSTYPFLYLQHLINPAYTNVFELYDGNKWFELKKVVIKGTTTRLVIWGDRIICTGRIKSFDNVSAPTGKYFGMIEYKNNHWDTMPGGTFDSAFSFGNVCATKESLYFATYGDSNFIHHSRIYKYDEGSGNFNRVADIKASWGSRYRIIAGKSKLLFSNIIAANDKSAIGFAYLNDKDSVISNSDSSFSPYTLYGIDCTDDHIYGVQEFVDNLVTRYRILEFGDKLIQIRYSNTLPGTSYLINIQVWKGNIIWNWSTSDFKIKYYYTLCKGDTVWNVLEKDFTVGSSWFGPLVSRHGVFIQDFDNKKMLQLHVGQGANIRGTAYVDIDSNCFYNQSIDQVLPDYKVNLKINGSEFICFSNKNGQYDYFVQKGLYTVAHEKKSSACFNDKISISKDSSYILDVPVKGPAKFDYKVQFQKGFNIRWNSNFVYSVSLENLGFPADSANFSFNIDSRIILDSCSIKGAITGSNVASGKIYNLSYNDIRKIHFYCRMDTSQLKPDSIIYSSFVSRLFNPEPDLTDNYFEMTHRIVYSFDPNYKNCSKQKIAPETSEKLEYYIEFQNEGNDDAYDVVLVDTLSSSLDLDTLSITGYSHPAIIKLSGNVLTVTYSNIFLKPKNVDEEASKGYFKFSIFTNDSLKNGHLISNTAYIYFDLNKPVVTAPAITQVIEDHTNGISVIPLTYLVYPNPSNNIFNVKFNTTDDIGIRILVYDISGKLVSESIGDTQNAGVQIDLTSSANGIYTAHITVGNNTFYVKLLKY